MADGYSTDLQKGLRAALVADAGVAALVSTRVYDKPPQPAVYPYIRFGSFEVDNADTCGSRAAFVTASIEVHSESIAGSIEAQRIAEAVRAALHRNEGNVTLANHTLVELIELTGMVTRDSSGASFTAVLVYRAYLDT